MSNVMDAVATVARVSFRGKWNAAAPTISTARPSAASGVSHVAMPTAPGRISPSDATISAQLAIIRLTGMFCSASISFNRGDGNRCSTACSMKSAANRICKTHRAMFITKTPCSSLRMKTCQTARRRFEAPAFRFLHLHPFLPFLQRFPSPKTTGWPAQSAWHKRQYPECYSGRGGRDRDPTNRGRSSGVYSESARYPCDTANLEGRGHLDGAASSAQSSPLVEQTRAHGEHLHGGVTRIAIREQLPLRFAFYRSCSAPTNQ